jgi:hypothetical protein
MHLRPDYEALRRDTATAFEWSVTGSYLAYLKMAEVPTRDFFL